MFKIQIHATGSKGNAYSIIDGDRQIMIDPGIRFKLLQKATNFTLSKYDFFLLSHEHRDHSRSIVDLLRMGKNCYMSQGTRDSMGILDSAALYISSQMPFARDGWQVMPFEIEHDAAEPLGFLILSPSGKKILFATDTCYIRFKFSGVTHWMVECNYSEEILVENTELTDAVKDRIRASHFEIGNVKEFFAAQDLSATEEIYLIHLSDHNSDAKKFVETIKNLTGTPIMSPQ
jgi:phosphoribosyl 1,2-cyclic phosphodiesterase